MIQLMCELNAGIRSAEDEGWISEAKPCETWIACGTV